METPPSSPEALKKDRTLIVFVLAATVALALPRFAHTTPDSVYYTNLLAYFQGTLPRETLQTPFAFRWFVPALASLLPGVSPTTALGLCSLVATMGAGFFTLKLWGHLLQGRQQLVFAMTLLVCSFPTINYGSAALTDAAGFLVLAAASWFMVGGRFYAMGAVLIIGACVRESTLLMVPALWLYTGLLPRPRRYVAALMVTLATLLAALASRWYFADLPAYFWTPSWPRFLANLTRPVSWATVLLTLLPLLLLLCLPGKNNVPLPRPTRAYIIAMTLPCLALMAYAMSAAFMGGRFCWPLYLPLIPLVVWRRAGL